MPPSPMRQRLLALAPTLALLSLAPPTTAFADQYEQFDRADGVAGLMAAEGATTGPSILSPDGRNVFFRFEPNSGTTWKGTEGLYRRDLLTNRTTRIDAGFNSYPAGLTDDGTLLSFTTKNKLVSADQNTTWDLYSYNAVTGAIGLLSRWDGVNGLAIGLTSRGYVTRDGKSALFGTHLGIGKRMIAAGTTVKVDGTDAADGISLAASGYLGRVDTTGSADGRVFVSRRGSSFVTLAPSGVHPLPGVSPYAPSVLVSPSGAKVAYNSVDVPGAISLLESSTGTTTQVAGGGALENFSPDETTVRVWRRGATAVQSRLHEVDLATATTTNLGLWEGEGLFSSLSADLRFGVVGSFVRAAGSGSLPGGADLPSPAVFLVFDKGCKGYLGVPSRGPSLGFLTTVGGYTAQSVAWKALDGSNRVLAQGTGARDSLPTKSQGWKLQLTVTYGDGRTNTATYSILAPPTCWI